MLPNRASDAGPDRMTCRCGGRPIANCDECGRLLCWSHALIDGDVAVCAKCKAIQADLAEESHAEELTLP